MGFFDRFRRPQKPQKIETSRPSEADAKEIVVGARSDADETQIQTFSNNNITYNGELVGFDYTTILRDKQGHIVDLYRLSDYYVDADPIVRGIVKHVFTPYSAESNWFLYGAKEKTCKLYEAQYEKMRLKEKMRSIF